MNRFCSRILKSINMDHIGIFFAFRVVFAVKIWKKSSMIVWTIDNPLADIVHILYNREQYAVIVRIAR